MENFRKTAYIVGKLRKKYVGNAYQTIFLSTFWYHELEIARFGACAPRAGAVDVKRLIYRRPPQTLIYLVQCVPEQCYVPCLKIIKKLILKELTLKFAKQFLYTYLL